ncbi:MAG: tyrosine-type recombinase/integrase [Lachnospiraceae bacterium]|nr:tyrosine-type recombinase/integrase [Lachnospiraceae bacterium]
MNSYITGNVSEGNTTYYYVINSLDMEIVKTATRYLKYRVRANYSPNTIKRCAFSISYYLTFLDKNDLTLGDVMELSFDKQHAHFTDFLSWLKCSGHTEKEFTRIPTNKTCNDYLRDVFGWFSYMEAEYEDFGDLKVLFDKIVTFSGRAGVKFSKSCKSFKGYLKEDESVGKSIDKESIKTLVSSCTNCRDKLMLLLLSETGFRIGEMLGIKYDEDIDYKNKSIKVMFRDDNDNNARAKNAEYRRAKVSNETFDILLYYLSEYKEIIKGGRYLFVKIKGERKGEPEDIGSVYQMMKELTEKTNIKVTPHMLRHYFANERRKSGWDLLLISKALGHKNVSTTERYLNIDMEELSEASEEFYSNNPALFNISDIL